MPSHGKIVGFVTSILANINHCIILQFPTSPPMCSSNARFQSVVPSHLLPAWNYPTSFPQILPPAHHSPAPKKIWVCLKILKIQSFTIMFPIKILFWMVYPIFRHKNMDFPRFPRDFLENLPDFPLVTAQPSDVPETPCHAAFGRAPKCPRPQKQREIVKTSWDFCR